MQLHWQTSDLASCFYALDCIRRGRLPQDNPIALGLKGPALRLHTALAGESIREDVFWSHLIPLAALYPSLHELADVTLRKAIGAERAYGHAEALAGRLEDAKIAFTAAIVEPRPDLLALAAPTKQAWDYQGAGLIGRVANWTDPGLVADEATIVLVHPALMGGGAAHLQYNLVTLEPVAPDPAPELPEVLRLGWLLSMLNLDLPRFSENIDGPRLPTVASLAMVPVVLTAAQELELGRFDQGALSSAIQNWIPEAAGQVAVVREWWDSYTSMRPAWATALTALDRLTSA